MWTLQNKRKEYLAHAFVFFPPLLCCLCSLRKIPKCKTWKTRTCTNQSRHTNLGWLSLHSFDFTSNEAIQHRLKQVDHKSDLRFILVPCQCVHFVVVTLHQIFVCNLGLLSVTKSMEANKQSECICRYKNPAGVCLNVRYKGLFKWTFCWQVKIMNWPGVSTFL